MYNSCEWTFTYTRTKDQRILLFLTNFLLGRNAHRIKHYTVQAWGCWPMLALQGPIITCVKNRTEQFESKNAGLGYTCTMCIEGMNSSQRDWAPRYVWVALRFAHMPLLSNSVCPGNVPMFSRSKWEKLAAVVPSLMRSLFYICCVQPQFHFFKNSITLLHFLFPVLPPCPLYYSLSWAILMPSLIAMDILDIPHARERA